MPYGYPHTREPLARAEGPQTSRDAAVRAFADQAAQQSIIHNFLRGRGALGTTAREIATGTGLTMEQVCRRLPEMRDAAMASTANGKDGPGCLPLERREGCCLHWAREWAR